MVKALTLAVWIDGCGTDGDRSSSLDGDGLLCWWQGLGNCDQGNEGGVSEQHSEKKGMNEIKNEWTALGANGRGGAMNEAPVAMIRSV
ncbi:hypothetical protein ES702_00103 [subsurface metagenome]